jgi:predicted transposase YdaD
MAFRFDATLKELLQAHPEDLLAALDEPPAGPVEVLSPDLSTVTALTDVVLRSGDTVLHIDFQSGPDPTLPQRMLLYNALLYDQYVVPVHSLVVLLRPRADRGDLTGRVQYQARPGRGGMNFAFDIVRLWQRPVETLLSGGLGTLPLAPLGQLPEGQPPEAALPSVIERVVSRIQAEAPPEEVPTLLTTAYVLTGLRVSQSRVSELFQGVRVMRESTAYQAILDEGAERGRTEGRTEEARKLLLRLGGRRFGNPDEAAEAALKGITDLERLEHLIEHIQDASNWIELLQSS